jgi:AAA domain
MYRRYLNARSPLRLLEKGLHGGLGPGNLGLVIAGPGVGKTSFLVGVALDELLRSKPVLHIALDHNVQHVRDYYDTVFEELAHTTRLDENHVAVRAEMDRLRRIRVYPHGSFDAKRLREALALEAELGPRPELVVVDGLDVAQRTSAEMEEWASAARDAHAEVWMGATVSSERIAALPAELQSLERCFAVILAMEPGEGSVALRALKDHDSSDMSALHVALDPKTLLLVRS